MTLLKVVGVLLMGLNFLAAPLAIVWLLVLGEWWVVGVAVLSLFSHFVLSILLIPGMALAVPAVALTKRRPHLALIAGIPALLYTATLITVWCIGALIFLMSRATAESWIPLLLLSYSIGTAPWAYMAQHEIRGGGGEGSMIATVFMQLAFAIVVCYSIVFRPDTAEPLWWIFGIVMGVEVLVCLAYAQSAAAADARAQPSVQDGNLDLEERLPRSSTARAVSAGTDDLPF